MAFDAIHDHFLAAAHAADPWKMPRPWEWEADRAAASWLFDQQNPNDFLITGWNKGVADRLGQTKFTEASPGSANYYKDDALGDALYVDTTTQGGLLLNSAATVTNNDAYTIIHFGRIPNDGVSNAVFSWRTNNGKKNVLCLKQAGGGIQVVAHNDADALVVNNALSGVTYTDTPVILVYRTGANGTDFYAGTAFGWETFSDVDQTSSTAAYYNIHSWDNVWNGGEGGRGWLGYHAVIGRAITDGEVQALLRDPTAPIRPKYDLAALSVALEQTAAGTTIAANLATRTRTTHAATISRAYNITANLATRTRTTHAATITATQAELPVPDTQPGGWLPRTIYVDDDGNPVDLDEIKEAVAEAVDEALEAEQPKQAKAVRRSADRVLARLSAAQTASQKDIQRLRAAIAQSEAALAALDRAIEAQEDEDAAVALLLAH